MARGVRTAASIPHLIGPPTPDRWGMGERTEQFMFSKGLLGHETAYEIIVSGPFTAKHLEALIRKLEIDLEILRDSESPHTQKAGA
jgi:hypothetical protein